MNNILVTESLYLVNHAANEKTTEKEELLFSSTNRNTPGQAYEINITDHNTGYSDLTFKMPTYIINSEGQEEYNPKLALLKPLSKVRYNRIIRYMGKEPIAVPNPREEGGITYYPKNEGKHPNDYIMENYTMDYIIQPLDKSRQGLGINLTFSAMDFPRFNLSKKKMGLTFDNQTITTQDLSLYKNKPLSVPGSIQYVRWDSDLAKNYQMKNYVGSLDQLNGLDAQEGDLSYLYINANNSANGIYQYTGATWEKLADDDTRLTTWAPNPQSGSYPLTEAQIKNLVSNTDFSYGLLATIYYWPITRTARFEGVHYEINGFLTLSLYNTYEGSDWNGSEYLDSITWKWGFLEPMKPYLSPNTACHYLQYILKDTNWSVKGDKDLLLSNGAQVYYLENAKPSNGVKGNYYLNFKANQARDGFYDLYIMRHDGTTWVDETENAFGQVVNTAHEIIDRQIVIGEDFGTLYDIDIEMVEVARSASAGIGAETITPARYSMNVSNTNCYNAIAEEAKTFDLYPVFDCINRTVSLKLNAGKDFGLTYRLGSNIKNSSVKVDGEKVITKLYCTGGTDANGSANITLGEANRVIEGTSAELVSTALNNYNATTLKTKIHALEENAYNHMVGVKVSTGLNLANYKMILNFPDNLGQTIITDPTMDGFDTAIITGNKATIRACYNKTGTDYNYIIYISNGGANDYKDETKQLYKYSCGDFALRRNLTTFKGETIGTVSAVARTEANYIKYAQPLQTFDSILQGQLELIDDDYEGYVTDIVTGYNYELDAPDTENFVLTGPDRVIANDPERFQVGTYYLINNKYYFCAGAYTDDRSGCAYQKINAIVIEGILLLEMGTPSTAVTIKVGGKAMSITKRDGTVVTLGEWMTNDYCIRVKNTGSALVEDGEFDPNAPEYLIGRSPYGTSYIYNFKYLYDNGWMSETDIKKIYEENKLINEENIKFYNMYSQDLINAQAAYDDAINNCDLYATKADAQLEALMSQYWVNPNKASDDHFSAFPAKPADGSVDNEKHMYKTDITYEDPETGEEIFVQSVYYNVFNSAVTNELYPHSLDNKTDAKNPDGEGQYHVVLKAIGWDENVGTPFTINTPLDARSEAEDPSKTIDNYNKHVLQMKEYYYKAMKAQEQADEAALVVEAIAAEFDAWQKRVAEHEKTIQEAYGHLIIEGSYANQEQPYANLLLRDSLEASDKYCTPDVTYSVGVVDAGGLLEYRTPQLLVCNDLVKKLHSAGQIVPHAGDYVSIYDEAMGMYKVAGLITQIGRRIDNPYQNTITIDTSYTDADELVGNIITATNTVLSNKDIYGRAAIINNKGELSSTTVSKALSSGTDSINIVSTSGKVQVDDNGLTCANPDNTSYQMRYNGTGIFASNNNGVTWKELMTQDGINANYINAGTVNTSRVAITDGQYDITSLDGNGLTIKKAPGKSYKIGVFDTKNWEAKNWDNVEVFVGHDANGKGVGYFQGYINATQGGNIGGWKIVSSNDTGSNYKYAGLYNGGTATNPNVYLGAGLASQTVGDTSGLNLVLKAGSKFGVSTDGTLYAKGANISGAINATSLTLGTDVKIDYDKIDNTPDLSVYIYKDGTVGSTPAEGATGFNVSSAGLLTASNAVIYGQITASSGKIGGWNISGVQLQKQVGDYSFEIRSDRGAEDPALLVYKSKGSGQGYKWYVRPDGYMYASSANVSGTINASGGSVGGWEISPTKLGSDNTYLNPNGSCQFYPSGGAIVGWNDGIRLKGPGGVALYDSYTNYNNSTTISKGVAVAADGGDLNLLQLNSTHGLNIRSYISSSTHTDAAAGAIQINAANNITLWSNNKNIYIQANSGKVYASSSENGNSPVKTDSGSTSSRSVKENITPFKEQDYNEALDILKQIDITTYNYKYDLYEKPEQYGFIIDDIEKIKGYDKFFDFYSDTAAVKDKSLIFGWENADEDYTNNEKIEVKKYNSDVLDKYLLTCIKALQSKIEILEEQLKKEKE